MQPGQHTVLSVCLVVGALLLAGCENETSVTSETKNSPPRLGLFAASDDIGTSVTPGTGRYDARTETYLLSGGTIENTDTEHNIHYMWKPMSGENIFFSAQVDLKGKEQSPDTYAGLIIRDSLEPDAAYASATLGHDGRIALEYREEEGQEVRHIIQSYQNASRVRLEKEGDYFYMSVAGDDGVWQAGGGNIRLPMNKNLHVGLAVSAARASTPQTAVFSNVEIRTPDMQDVTETGYPAGVDSTLEILDIETGNRRVVWTTDDKIEAPNWSRDGSYLIFNGEGKIWRLPVKGGEPVQINTGPQQRNNNDHGISPDGTELIISDQSAPDNISRIYKLPIEGSDTPELIVSHPTDRSYWHAWHPDGDLIAYTARRPEVSDSYNIWGKRLSGGDEFRLTKSDGLDDGADFSADGKWLYFNSTRSGAMQIWKIRPDGTDPRRVTFDGNYRDWFAHPSPDGKWIIMVSFGLDVDLADHPPNRDVWLRLMPADESAPPSVIAKLFGGQGTINVPSWSPDSSKVAFVSYRLDREDRP